MASNGKSKRGYDPASMEGKTPIAEAHVPLIVVGAGAAGLAAALTAAKAGVQSMLIDEHPVASALMGLDVPFHFGQRMDGAVQNKARMVERLVETNPAIGEAFELGVDVQLGVYVAGAFVNGPTVHVLEKPMLALADEERSWMVSFDRLIVAAGARDLGLSFTGWEKPGVMGAQAATALIQRYRAFNGRRVLILGSGALGLKTAEVALEAGIAVAGIVEVADTPRGPEALRAALAARGVPFFAGHALKEATGVAEVDGALLVRLDSADQPVAGSETKIACDTIVTALGVVPTVELLDVLGCRLGFHSELGGYVPELGADGISSIPSVHVVGDAAGTYDAKILDPAIAAAEGRRAGAAAAKALGGTPEDATAVAAPAGLGEQHGHWQRWLKAEIAVGGMEVNICQCEEVTRRELVELRPPRYLNWGSSQMQARSLQTLKEDGPINQDQVKRLTRAGMGPCQGRRCREQVSLLLAEATKTKISEIPLASYRTPVRPLPLNVLWPHEEPQEMRDNWVGWFDIPTMFLPHWETDAPPPENAERGRGLGIGRSEE
jgi:NADPH-dependent 2,4-dienoyl-CoA reductase/sulfur reductase-like enzyme